MRIILSALVAPILLIPPGHAATTIMGTGAPNANSVADVEAIVGAVPGLVLAHEVNDCGAATCAGSDDKSITGDLYTITLTDDGTQGMLDFSMPSGYELAYFTVKGGPNFELHQLNNASSVGSSIAFDTLGLPKGRSGTFGPQLSNMFFFALPSAEAVPIPASAALFGLGLAAYALHRRQIA
ncbi:MAG: hypothetical protein AAFR65_14850 [Pseudomonadota bacterium]